MAGIDDISDLWWLQPDRRDVGSEWLQGMKLGAEMRQQNIQNVLQEEQLRLQAQKMRATMDTVLAKQVTDAQRAKGFAALSSHLATVAENNAWGDPKALAETYKIGGDYANVFEKDEFDKIIENSFTKHQEFKLKQDEAERKAREETFRPEGVEEDELIQVRPGVWQQKRGTETIESYTDEQGHQQFRIVRGGKAPTAPGEPTTALKTKVQEGLLGAEKAVELGSKAFDAITSTPESVGLAGSANRVLINEGLAQIFPEMNKGSVSEAQTLLGNFNEKAVQALTASGDKRVSDKDMARFSRILPKMTAGESVESAKAKIKTFLGEIKREARTDAKTLGKPVPVWAMTADELVASVKSGTMTIDQAREIAKRYSIQP